MSFATTASSSLKEPLDDDTNAPNAPSSEEDDGDHRIIPFPFYDLQPIAHAKDQPRPRTLLFGFPIPREFFDLHYKLLKKANSVEHADLTWEGAYAITKHDLRMICRSVWPQVPRNSLHIALVAPSKGWCHLLAIAPRRRRPPTQTVVDTADTLYRYGVVETPNWFRQINRFLWLLS